MLFILVIFWPSKLSNFIDFKFSQNSNIPLESCKLIPLKEDKSNSVNDEQSPNIWLIFLTLLISKFETFIDGSMEQFLNIEFIYITWDVLKLSKSISIEERLIHDSNINSIFITFEVLKNVRFNEDKDIQFWNICSIFWTESVTKIDKSRESKDSQKANK